MPSRALASLTLAVHLGLSKSKWRVAASRTFWKTALRLCRLFAGRLLVQKSLSHWASCASVRVVTDECDEKSVVIENSPHAVRTLDDLTRIKGPAQAELGRGTLLESQRVGWVTRRV